MSDYDFNYLRFQDLTGRLVQFPDHGTWQIGRRLAIKERISLDGGVRDFKPSEAQAVYECSQTDGLHIGQAAILKLRIQIPYDNTPLADCTEGAKFAKTKEYNCGIIDEIKFLRRLTEAGCTAAPRFIAVKEGIQSDKGWDDHGDFGVPGGYVVWILMEKLPGEDLGNFFVPGKYTLQERQEIREAFRVALMDVERCNVIPMDLKKDNIMWDKGSRKCFMIDFEDANEFAPTVPKGYVREWDDIEYGRWMLAEEANFYRARG